MNEHCGNPWPHQSHSWLPDYPHALWCYCQGTPDDKDGLPAGWRSTDTHVMACKRKRDSEGVA